MTPHPLLAALNGRDVLLMGVVNVTPDSFSDGGRFLDLDAAVSHGRRLAGEGAHVVDVGGESTRPGAEPVDVQEELRRVVPVVRALADDGIHVSIDTRRAEVADAAIAAGAVLLNDVTGLRDPSMRAVAAAAGVPAVTMHMSVPDPTVMQQHTDYADVVAEVFDFLDAQARLALDEGIPEVLIDPGIGFGKTTEQNLELLRHLDRFVASGRPVLVGASRKRFIGDLTGTDEPVDRLGGTLAVHLFAARQGVRVLRVHDVAPHRQALTMWRHLAVGTGPTARPDEMVPGRGLEPL